MSDHADNSDVHSPEDGSEKSKRRRIARACDMCRKKKIKCDGKMPACTNCQNYHTECVFTITEKKRSPPKGAKYIEGLENRLGRMESLLKLSGIIPEADDGGMDLGTLEKELSDKQKASQSKSDVDDETPETSGTVSMGTSPGNAKLNDDEVGHLSGIQWVNERTGDKSFQDMLENVTNMKDKWSHLRSDVFCSLFTSDLKNPLPSKTDALSYIEATFECLFEQHHTGAMRLNSGWYAGCRLRVSQTSNAAEEWKGWTFFQNAASVLTELLLKNTDILTIQALLAMSLYLQGTSNPQPSYVLVAAAVRIANSIGIHRRADAFGFVKAEAEQRRRVFWIAYLLDTDIALRSGRPPAINDEDFNVTLPEMDPIDGQGTIELSGGRGKVNLFRLMCEFSLIASKVYMKLYSASAAFQSDGQLLNTIGQLDRELEEWKDSVPLDFRPEHEIAKEYHAASALLPLTSLHFAYYNCLMTIHRMSVQSGFWRLSNYAVSGRTRPINPRIFRSSEICVSAARATIHLIKFINYKDNPCAWLVLYYPVSALVTLFANILQNPRDSQALNDLKLMHVVVEFLQSLEDDKEEEGNLNKLIKITRELEKLAKLYLERSQHDISLKRKRKALAESQGIQSHDDGNLNERNINMGDGIATQDYDPQATAPSSDHPLLGLQNEINEGPFDSQISIDDPSLDSMAYQEPFVPQTLWNVEWDWTNFGVGINGQFNNNNNVNFDDLLS